MTKWSKLSEYSGKMYREVAGTITDTGTPTAISVTFPGLESIEHINVEARGGTGVVGFVNSIGTTTTTTPCGETGVTVPTVDIALGMLNIGASPTASPALETPTVATPTVMYNVLGVSN